MIPYEFALAHEGRRNGGKMTLFNAMCQCMRNVSTDAIPPFSFPRPGFPKSIAMFYMISARDFHDPLFGPNYVH